MFINKEGKFFGKVSIVDIFVVIAIVVAAFGVYSRFIKGNEKVSLSSGTIEYQMQVKKVRIGTVEALKKGGEVYDTETKEYMGEIIDAKEMPATEEQELLDGSIVLKEVPERYDAIITVRVDGRENDMGYYTNGNKGLYVGSNTIIASKFAKTTAEIISIQSK